MIHFTDNRPALNLSIFDFSTSFTADQKAHIENAFTCSNFDSHSSAFIEIKHKDITARGALSPSTERLIGKAIGFISAFSTALWTAQAALSAYRFIHPVIEGIAIEIVTRVACTIIGTLGSLFVGLGSYRWFSLAMEDLFNLRSYTRIHKDNLPLFKTLEMKAKRSKELINKTHELLVNRDLHSNADTTLDELKKIVERNALGTFSEDELDRMYKIMKAVKFNPHERFTLSLHGMQSV